MKCRERMDEEMQLINQYKLKNAGTPRAPRDLDLKVMESILQINSNLAQKIRKNQRIQLAQQRFSNLLSSERGDVPGWVLVVLMTTGLVTAIWTIAAPRLTSILKNSLDAMNGIR